MHFYKHIKFKSVKSTALFKNACVNRKIMCACSVVSDSLQPHGLYPARLLCPWGFPGKRTGVDFHSHLQRLFLSQGGSEPISPASPALAGGFFTATPPGKPWKNGREEQKMTSVKIRRMAITQGKDKSRSGEW